MKFFDIDGPVVQFLSKVADLMWLNILTIVCCIPVITIGASLTALNYMALKIVRNEETYITKGFFKAFKENFKQSTVIWLIFMVLFSVIYVDYRIVLTTDVQIGNLLRGLIVMVVVLIIFTFMYVFPLQSKFSNTIKKTIQNAFILSIMQWPKTLLMILLYLLPYVLFYVFPGLIPLVLVFCLSVPAILSARLNHKFFRKMEEQILSQGAERQGTDGQDTDGQGIDTQGTDTQDIDGQGIDGQGTGDAEHDIDSGEQAADDMAEETEEDIGLAGHTATDVSENNGQND
ncbi:MAG: DUF624 domain-containing protein [Lachnospiraceae bacterium]|nr:DUF624 domain-containing protein [Lachnospiraceae bacterium]